MQTITATMPTMPAIKWSRDGWQTQEESTYRTFVEIDWRKGTIEVYKLGCDERYFVPTRFTNNHAARMMVAPGTPKVEIVNVLEIYWDQISEIMASYEQGIHVSETARFGEASELLRFAVRGIAWALEG
jgi:hypothetical protein